MRRPAPCRTALPLAALAALLGGCAHLGPENSAARLVSAEVALERGDYPFAAREYRRAAAESRDAAVAERAARVAFDTGQAGELARTAREWLAREPKNESPRRFLAVALLELDDRPGAERELAALLASAYATPAEGFTALGESLGTLRNETGVAAVAQRLAARYPAVAEAQYAAGSLSLNAGDSPSALAAVARALALRPDWREARWLEVRARIAGGDCGAGLKGASALAAESTDSDRLVYAWLLTACDRGAEAQPYFADLARGRLLRAEALEGLASLEVESRRYDEAAGHYTEMLGTGRNADRAFFGLALLADRKGERERAEKLYLRVTSGQRAVTAQLRAYRLGLERGEALAAARQLDDFVTADADHRVDLTAGRAQILAERGRAAEALALLARAAAAYPDRAELRLARATVLEQGGEIDAALGELRAIARSRPADPTAANALGFTLADHNRELGEAERLIRQALTARPDSAAIRDSLGWVLYRRGRGAEGLEWLRRAYAAESDPEIATHVGEVEWSLGDRSGAERTWRSALDRNPGDPHLLKALEQHLGPRP
ncbi:MAG: tetratricopeptide repeat protein [Proteobacteria bacterium]|nr:tetratricopeptide repeat protein [Pseudomonadota bacterium]